jgi:hypothetical protein
LIDKFHLATPHCILTHWIEIVQQTLDVVQDAISRQFQSSTFVDEKAIQMISLRLAFFVDC